ncbi:unnamed protein product [Schistosoma bovis]|nr:unnamed protein product [Schistosoma bovis]
MPRKKKVKSGKKRGKRLKTSRKKTVLEAKIDKFCADEEKYIDFLKRSNLWIKCHAEQLKNLLHLTAHYSDLNFTYDDFKAALLSLKCPFTKFEIDVITRLLDKNKNGFIDYQDLTCSLTKLSLEDGTLKELSIERIAKSDRGSVICKFNCLNCINIHESPLHFEQLVPLNTYTEGLVNIIRHKTLLWLPKISIFLSVNAEPAMRCGLNINSGCLKYMIYIAEAEIGVLDSTNKARQEERPIRTLDCSYGFMRHWSGRYVTVL